MKILVCLALAYLATTGDALDLTRSPNAYGASVVEAVVNMIRETCLFADDRRFLRRLAYVESSDGNSPLTYRTGFDGGIWQIDRSELLATKNEPQLNTEYQIIQDKFGIDWSTVTWSDLRKPLYSGIAAALYTKKELMGSPISWKTEEQGTFWGQNFNHGSGGPTNFTDLSKILDLGCTINQEVDLVFVLDTSSSLSDNDFNRALDFIKSVIDGFPISPVQTQIGMVTFSSQPHVEFYLNSHQSKTSVKDAVSRVPNRRGGTATDQGLDSALNYEFSPSHGARPNAVKVMVVITDGQSDDKYDTHDAAERVHNAGIVTFSVGVGHQINKAELGTIATDPDCTHAYEVSSFSEIKFMREEIQKATCNAPVFINATYSCVIDKCPPIAVKTDPDKGTTIETNITCGGMNVYSSINNPYPSRAQYEYFIQSYYGNVTQQYYNISGQNLYFTLKDNQKIGGGTGSSGCIAYITPLNGNHIDQSKHVECYVGSTQVTCDGSFFNCEEKWNFANPCTAANIKADKLRFPHPYDNNKFLMCDLSGKMYIVYCPPGELFFPDCGQCVGTNSSGVSGCKFQATNITNPCTRETILAGKLFFAYPYDTHMFIHCDIWGRPWVRIDFDGTRNCGLCGDDYRDPVPRPNEWGGLYANPRVRTRYYEAGQIAEISIWNNLPGAPGFYEFRLCDEDDNQSQACLNKHLLTIIDTNTTNMPVPQTQGLVMIHLQLPAGVTCDYCLLQWRFRKESIEGCDDNNWCGLGRGAQIEYYNCADVMIGAVGQPKPSFIQDPAYSAADYGSAYDIGQVVTSGPDNSNLGGGTTQSPTTTDPPSGSTTTQSSLIIITNRPPRTTTTTQNVTTTSQTPVVTTTENAKTTSNTAVTPGTTTGPASAPNAERIVINADGSSAGTVTLGGGTDSSNNKQLLVLLSILPILGAYGLQQSRSTGVIPPAAPVTWANQVPMYPIYFGNSLGFGNFAAADFGTIGGGVIGTQRESYHTSGTLGTIPRNTNTVFGTGSQNLDTIARSNFQNTNVFTNNVNTGIQTPNTVFNNNGLNNVASRNSLIWNNNGANVHNQFRRFRRAVAFQTGNSYQHTPNEYSNTGQPNQPFMQTNQFPSVQVPRNFAGNNIGPQNSPMMPNAPSNEYGAVQTSHEYGSQNNNNQWPNQPVASQTLQPLLQSNQATPQIAKTQNSQNGAWASNGQSWNQAATSVAGSEQNNEYGHNEMSADEYSGIGETIKTGQDGQIKLPSFRPAQAPPTANSFDPFRQTGMATQPTRRTQSGPFVSRNVALVKNTRPFVSGRGTFGQFMNRGFRPQMPVTDWYRILFGQLPLHSNVI
ncbi:hypothetical protein ACF0H5_019782 [Mactra antiquata]